MFKRKKFSNAFLQVSKEHKIYHDIINQLKNLVNSGPQAGNFKALKGISQTLKDGLFGHFQLEEQVLFPAALLGISDVETADQILLLTREHGAFERDVHTLNQIVECHPGDNPNIPQPTLDFLSVFVDNLDAHAKIEMDELFPKMDQNRKCLEVIRDFVD